MDRAVLRRDVRYYNQRVVQATRPTGAISTEHSSSELMVIGTNAHRFDSYFLHLTRAFTGFPQGGGVRIFRRNEFRKEEQKHHARSACKISRVARSILKIFCPSPRANCAIFIVYKIKLGIFFDQIGNILTYFDQIGNIFCRGRRPSPESVPPL